jgi:hypothetical protein
MYHTTGLEKAEILDLCEMMIHRDATVDERTWPPILGLYKSVVVTLTLWVPETRLRGADLLLRHGRENGIAERLL